MTHRRNTNSRRRTVPKLNLTPNRIEPDGRPGPLSTDASSTAPSFIHSLRLSQSHPSQSTAQGKAHAADTVTTACDRKALSAGKAPLGARRSPPDRLTRLSENTTMMSAPTPRGCASYRDALLTPRGSLLPQDTRRERQREGNEQRRQREHQFVSPSSSGRVDGIITSKERKSAKMGGREEAVRIRDSAPGAVPQCGSAQEAVEESIVRKEHDISLAADGVAKRSETALVSPRAGVRVSETDHHLPFFRCIETVQQKMETGIDALSHSCSLLNIVTEAQGYGEFREVSLKDGISTAKLLLSSRRTEMEQLEGILASFQVMLETMQQNDDTQRCSVRNTFMSKELEDNLKARADAARLEILYMMKSSAGLLNLPAVVVELLNKVWEDAREAHQQKKYISRQQNRTFIQISNGIEPENANCNCRDMSKSANCHVLSVKNSKDYRRGRSPPSQDILRSPPSRMNIGARRISSSAIKKLQSIRMKIDAAENILACEEDFGRHVG